MYFIYLHCLDLCGIVLFYSRQISVLYGQYCTSPVFPGSTYTTFELPVDSQYVIMTEIIMAVLSY
jgi:hypothetical protein